jgi:hypothetical protein
MLIVGSSTTSGGSASGAAGSQMVSEISGYSMPANATMSPALAEEAHHLHDPLVAHLAVAVDDHDRAAAANAPALDAPDADGADVARVVEQAHLQLQRAVLVDVRRRAVLHDRFEQRRHVGRRRARLVTGEAAQRGGVHHREIELRLARAELVEQVERLVEHPVRARLLAVDLVDDHDRPQPVLEGLLRDEACLRHRPIERVDDEEHPIDHSQNTLDLASKVGVPGRIDDIDFRLPPANRCILGEDGDPPLTLERVGVHHALLHHLVFAECARLAEHLVDERGLAVIDVRDNGDVADLHRLLKISGLPLCIQARRVYGTDGATFVRMSHSPEVRHGTA